ncbi:putative multidrug resistance protein EmrK [Acaryochloris thomasi RCC1774]|uniref:Putative multidrug resistance protein EmrK n=1 Tax=Acaryochloris thomasi RCC1774 TaxID=1764569 RepID=A0A2W1JX88_9CYAN|nr:efflux RND transporter periplasmic adaptor subunit [Acaryochloris thomasi]PZD72957.1 putative multidrug resistance protein EmrK [Acaryochloris thomasi RCC1774]
MFFNLLALRLRLLTVGLVILTTACGTVSASDEANAPPTSDVIAVDVAIATPNKTQSAIYTGTTAPIREVLLRSQIQGQLQRLSVKVGDRIQQGQVLGQQDDDVLTGSVNEARAQREAQVAEVASARSQVGAVSTQVEQARLGLVQAKGNILQLQNAVRARTEEARLQVRQTQSDAVRLTQLAKDGAISEQRAEQARTQAQQAQQNLVNIQASGIQEITQAQTAVKTAAQVLQAAESQVAMEQGTVDAAQMRVLAQQSVLNQAQKQRTNAVLTAPLTGIVMERLAEEGNLLQAGDEVLRLGDFKQVKVIVQVSERLLSQLRVGQQTQITLDAFPQRNFSGKITRISPLANSARLLPVEIVMANNGKIGSGLLARVSFVQPQQQRVWIPETALQTNGGRRRPSTGKAPQASPGSNSHADSAAQKPDSIENQATLFVLETESPEPRVASRSVVLGERRNGQVEIIQGLSPGESFVSRSSEPLKDQTAVSLSAISESPENR